MVSYSAGHISAADAAALSTAGRVTKRWRSSVPPPHGFVHCPSATQSLTWQDIVHFWRLQACSSFSMLLLQCAPPNIGAMRTARERFFKPPLHDLSHRPQLDQSDATQSIGQWCVLHAASSSSAGHGRPPCAGLTVTLRWRWSTPVPHSTEQPPHDVHSETAQLRGHGLSLHSSVEFSAGHAVPLLLAATSTSRVRFCVPPPHETSQPCHAPKSETAQFTGHAGDTHPRCSRRTCEHIRCCAWARTLRVRICLPPSPHATSHSLQAVQFETMQSHVHRVTLQGCVSLSQGHSRPPYAAAVVTLRWREVVAAPQLALQLLHADQWLTSQCCGHGSGTQ